MGDMMERVAGRHPRRLVDVHGAALERGPEQEEDDQ